MSKKGWKTVLIMENAYNQLKELSQKQNQSICKTLSKIIIEYITQPNQPLNAEKDKAETTFP